MPFVHDESEIEWPEDGTEPAPPRPEEFVYIPAPEFGGPPEPVRFAARLPEGRSQPTPGRIAEDLARRRQEADLRYQRVLSVMISALRQVGGRRVYGRYDGGNDEGFGWFDSLELQDGERIGPDALAARLHEARVHELLRAAGETLHPMPGKDRSAASEQQALKFFLDGWLCNEWAALLLGRSFGTGAFSMYGAFTVDLETCTITDDPRADPVVRNITIAP